LAVKFNRLTTSTATRWLVTSARILPCIKRIDPVPPEVSEIGSMLPGSMLAVAIASYRPGTNSKTLPATIIVVRSASATIHPRRRRITRTWLRA
jgi:hypothetical protein